MATAPSPNDLTRQQLDELDALLQRMLSVPLPPDTPAGTGGAPREGRVPTPATADPPLPPSWRIDPPPRPSGGPVGNTGAREGSTPHLLLADPPAASLKLEPPTPSALAQTPPPAATLKPVAKAAVPSTAAPKASPPPAAAPPAPPKSVPVPVTPPPKVNAGLTPAPAAPTVPMLFLPFVAFNALFDHLCGIFGPPGLVLRSGFFKQMYGLIGLVLLIYTGAHVAQTRMWISLPLQLPWPQ